MTAYRSPLRSSVRSAVYSPLVGKWGGDALAAFLKGATYADWDFSKSPSYVDTNANALSAVDGDRIGLTLAQPNDGRGVVNKLRFSSQIDQWTNGGAAATVTPNALGTMDRVDFAGSLGGKYIAGAAALGSGGARWEPSVYIQKISASGTIRLQNAQDSARGDWGVNLSLLGSGTERITRDHPAVTVQNEFTSNAGAFEGIYLIASAALSVYAGGAQGDIGTVSTALQETGAVLGGPGTHAYQATSGDRLTLDITGGRITAQGDATGDNLLTTFLASAGANSIIFDVDVPATLAASQFIAGLSGSSTGRISVGINTSGQLVASVGNQTSTTIVGSTDFRGQRLIGCLSVDGTTVRLMASSVEYEAAQSGNPITGIPLRLLATNNNGTASGFFGGGAKRIIHAHKAMTYVQWQAIRAQLAA